MLSGHTDVNAGVNVLVVNKNGEKNDDVNETVVVNTCHHDRENETLMSTAHQDGRANASPLCTNYPAKIDSAVESGIASEAHRE